MCSPSYSLPVSGLHASMSSAIVPMGGGAMPNAISMASEEATECTPPQTPQTRLEMNIASRTSRPLTITSYRIAARGGP